MIRSFCKFELSGRRCGIRTRARRYHDFCRIHHKEVTGERRAIPHQIKKTRVIRTKPVPVITEKKGKRK